MRNRFENTICKLLFRMVRSEFSAELRVTKQRKVLNGFSIECLGGRILEYAVLYARGGQASSLN